MSPEILAIATLFAVIIVLCVERKMAHDRNSDTLEQMREHYNHEYERFDMERTQLLDRIQAESFRDYKTQQIRMTKAQNKSDPEHPALELL